MRKVYEADNYIDAQIARGWLEAAGIPALLSGEHLVGAMGELPAFGLHSLWVTVDHEAEAHAALTELAAQRSQPSQDQDTDAPDGGFLSA